MREKMRCTLDRYKLTAMREQLMVELVKLKALDGTVEDAGRNEVQAFAVIPLRAI